ncbi:hypothetical protein [Paenarthrobacter nitroguajacolicus]|uniref:hypothetical protein n=1 Tax=Paenarthrobacter nitroguajacolicus TaxID=211146 RepID=UPI0040543F8B
MTSRDSEREAIVDELLLEADAADATDVRLALISMGSFANLAAPTPGVELSAMLAGPHDEVSKRRWRNKHRTAVVSVAVVAAMGLGVSGVAAASSGFTRNPSFIDELLGNVRPLPAAATPVLPVPDAPRVSTEPAPVVDPAALPSVPPVASITAPSPVPPAETQAQAPDVVQAPAPAAAQEAPAAGPAQSNAAQGKDARTDSAPSNVAAKPAPNPQEKPGQVTGEKQHTAKPDASLQDAGKPGKLWPGAEGIKPGQLPPGLIDQQTDEQLQAAADKWKLWLSRGHR